MQNLGFFTGGEILTFLDAGGRLKMFYCWGEILYICCQEIIPIFSAAGSKIRTFNIAGKKY